MKKYIFIILPLIIVIGIIFYAFSLRGGRELTLSDFENIKVGTSYAEVEKQFGKPDKEIGSGLHIPVYTLSDGSEVMLGFAENLLYIKHRLSDGTIIDISPRAKSNPPLGS